MVAASKPIDATAQDLSMFATVALELHQPLFRR